MLAVQCMCQRRNWLKYSIRSRRCTPANLVCYFLDKNWRGSEAVAMHSPISMRKNWNHSLVSIAIICTTSNLLCRFQQFDGPKINLFLIFFSLIFSTHYADFPTSSATDQRRYDKRLPTKTYSNVCRIGQNKPLENLYEKFGKNEINTQECRLINGLTSDQQSNKPTIVFNWNIFAEFTFNRWKAIFMSMFYDARIKRFTCAGSENVFTLLLFQF